MAMVAIEMVAMATFVLATVVMPVLSTATVAIPGGIKITFS